MPKTFLENWFLGPHESRSPVGALFFGLVTSKFWESLFLSYILFNAVVKATDTRDKSDEKAQFLGDVGFYACIVFSIEWLIEILAYGVRDFFADRWYLADTVVNIMNWGSYLRDVGFLPRPYSLFFPNIAFLRMLRFLKPLGRIRALTRAKVVVKTVARALGDMGPVLALVGFVVLFFGIVGIYLFGKTGQMLYRCGIVVPHEDAAMLYDPVLYEPHARRHILAKNFTINMKAYTEFVEIFEEEFHHFKNHTKHDHHTSQREINEKFRLHLLGKLEWTEEMMDMEEENGPHAENATFFAHVPNKICTCPAEEESAVNVCIDPLLVCDTGLCFLSGMSPVSEIHGFSNFAQSAMIVIAVFFQKSWSKYMDLSLAVSAMFGYVYFLFLVVFGSFCLLNLTVATVGQNYSIVIKETEEKMAAIAAKKAEEEKIEAERSLKQKAPTGEDGEEEKPNVFNTKIAYILWLIGLFGIPFLHRLYFKNWYRGRMFILRCVTFNYFLLGWIVDAFIMPSLNSEASEAERERVKERMEHRRETLEAEKERLELLRTNETIVSLCTFLCYPQMTLAIEESLEQHNKVYDKFLADHGEDLEAGDAEAGDMEDQDSASSQSSLDDLDDEEMQRRERDKLALEHRIWLAQRSGQSFFAWVADLVVVANAFTLAMQGFDDSLNVYLHSVGYFASIFFIGEAIAKYVAYGGWKYYLNDGGNRFDFILVVVPTIGELCTITTGRILNLGADYIYQMLALQAMRVFRIAKLTKHLTGLKKLTRKAFKSKAAVGYALAVTIVFIVFCSLFAMELFKRSTEFAARRNDFQYFLEAMKAMIEFLFGESYFENLELGYAEQDIVGVLYFVLYFYIANFIVLRMFIALIMANFEFLESERVNLQVLLFQKNQVLRNDLIDGNAKAFPLAEQKERLRKQNTDEDHLKYFKERWNQVVQDRAAEQGQTKQVKHLWDLIIAAAEREKPTLRGVHADEETELWKHIMAGKTMLRSKLHDLLEWKYFVYFVATAIVFSVCLIQIDPPEDPILDPDVRQLVDRSLLAFFTCEVFAKMFVFGMFSQAQPVLPASRNIEFPAGKPPFFSSSEEGGWNILDFTFICIMMIDVFPNGISLGGFKTIRLVRIVRPMQKSFPTVKNLVAALINSFVSILHVLNLLLILMLLFGLMGITLFRGRLHSCNDLSAEGFGDCVGTSYGGIPDIECTHVDPTASSCPNNIGIFLEQPILVQRVWAPARSNFENIAEASMTLLRILSADSLRPLFHSLMDIPRKTELVCSGTGHHGHDGCPDGQSQYVVSDQPSPNSARENILFPIVFIFVGSAFISQLVIGVLIDSIRRQSGTALYTEAQRKWFATEKTLNSRLRMKTKPPPPTNHKFLPGREELYVILDSELYDTVMMVIIIINTFWMATEHFPAPAAYQEIKLIVDQCFIGIYTVETIAKLYSFGVISWQEHEESKGFWRPKKGTITSPYFRDSWNCFDFLVVLMSVLDSWILANVDLSEFKLLRVLRVFRLVKKVKTLQLMLSTLAGALKSIVSALFFLAIWIFIFAAIGSDPQMFRHVREGKVINNRWNFETIVNAMMLLFRIATGDSWFDIIYDCAVVEPYCSPPKTEEESPAFHQNHSDCGRGPVAYVFFILFWVGCNYIFLPLFVATLIDYFSEAQTDSSSLFTGEDCEDYAKVWKEFDPDSVGHISIESLRPFIERLYACGHRVGFRVSSERDRFKMVWARVMTNPKLFPEGGVQITEKSVQESLGLEEITRETIVKGFGYSQRAKDIREYVYGQKVVLKDKEVDFKFCAKVLVIFMQRKTFQDPLSSADLVNRGAALQQFMGMLNKNSDEYDDWKENETWKALAIHHDMVEPLDKGGGRGRGKGGKEVLDETNLPKILKALKIVRDELSPPDLPGQDPSQKPAKPTGAKRAELVRKIDSMQKSYDEIVDGMIEKVLYGENAQGMRCNGVVDILLNQIFASSAAKFAKKEIKKQGPWTMAKLHKKQSHLTKYSDSKRAKSSKHVPEVTVVPRGWLNSQKHRKPRRISKGPVFTDMTRETVDTLSDLVAPTVPPRSSSLALAQNNAVLDMAVQNIFRNDTWKQVFSQTHANAHEPSKQEPATSLSWRKAFEDQIKQESDKQQTKQEPATSLSSRKGPEDQTKKQEGEKQTGVFGAIFGGCSAPRKTPNNAIQ